MRYEFKLPDLAEGMIEGELVTWLVAAGDTVKPEQPMAEVMTDKATVVIPSPVGGQVLELPHAAGDIVKVGSTLFVLDASSDAPAQKPSSGDTATAARAPAAPAFVATPATSTAPPASASASTSTPPKPATASTWTPTDRGAKALAAPATRRLARELGVDIGAVVGTGAGGRVTAEDVAHHGQTAASAPAAAPPAAPATTRADAPRKAVPSWTPEPRTDDRDGGGDGEQRVKIRGLRKAIYETMTRSTSTAAHFTYVDEVDCENLYAAREKLAKAAEPKGVRVTYLTFIAKATLLALARFPKMNASVDDDAMEAVLKQRVHLGIAAATDAGLLVPVVKNADRMTLLELAFHIQGLGDRARQNTLRPDELRGSTFTITSLGKLGGLMATPVINHPEVGILGVHQMQKRAVVLEDEGDGDLIVVRRRMNLSLSFDHRWIDGHEGAAFAQAVKAYLEDPELMLLEMA